MKIPSIETMLLVILAVLIVLSIFQMLYIRLLEKERNKERERSDNYYNAYIQLKNQKAKADNE